MFPIHPLRSNRLLFCTFTTILHGMLVNLAVETAMAQGQKHPAVEAAMARGQEYSAVETARAQGQPRGGNCDGPRAKTPRGGSCDGPRAKILRGESCDDSIAPSHGLGEGGSPAPSQVRVEGVCFHPVHSTGDAPAPEGADMLGGTTTPHSTPPSHVIGE